MTDHVLTGFGFGPIQSGLFVHEAYQSGNFPRIVIAEIDQKLVDTVRTNNGCYWVNVAHANGIEIVQIEGIEIYNPNVPDDKEVLLEALSQSTEIVTSLPSVSFFDVGENSVASLIAAGLQISNQDGAIIYAAENNNHAAEILEEKVKGKMSHSPRVKVEFLNTVIGKMSQVVVDPQEITRKNLKPLAPGIERAFLVEEFNMILVSKCHIENFTPGIEVFQEKEDLLPFEEAKLYGHNAIHALLAYLGDLKGYKKMAELKNDEKCWQIARDAFLLESGAALIKKYAHLGDPLFTESGYREFAEDLLQRMTNPYLDDPVDRAARDPLRKLGLHDRIIGTMQVVWQQGIEPLNMAMGAAAGILFLLKNAKEYKLPENLRSEKTNPQDVDVEKILNWIWHEGDCTPYQPLIEFVKKAMKNLTQL
jgi:mannitol-1-phosphate 5-dehydrogenase